MLELLHHLLPLGSQMIVLMYLLPPELALPVGLFQSLP